MMKVFLCFLVTLIGGSLFAQKPSEEGIKWVNGLSWDQLKEKALIENKQIFLDFHATWCKPCKLMDKEVFTNDTVAKLVNKSFIAVKVQVDSSDKDANNVKMWYETAKFLSEQYKVDVLPTFLFFSFDGKLIHKGIGGKDIRQMLTLLMEALDSTQQFHTLLEQYKTGKITDKHLSDLARSAKMFGNDKFAQTVARQSIDVYYNKLRRDLFLTKNVIDFIVEFQTVIHQKDRIVEVCLKTPQQIDSLMFLGFARSLVDMVIINQIIIPALKSSDSLKTEPNWNKLTNDISKIFNVDYALRNIRSVKPDFFKKRQRWNEYVTALIEKIRNTQLLQSKDSNDAYELNNSAWEIFLHSHSEPQLKIAYSWINHASVLAMADSVLHGMCLDTKANILYKMGRRKEALQIAERAVILAPDDDNIKQNLNKMKSDRPTWN